MKALLISVLFASFCLTVFAAQFDSQIMSLFSQTQRGEGTYYGPNTGGSCTLNPVPPSGSNGIGVRVAINNPQYYGSATCGMCMQMVGNGVGLGANPIEGTQIVFVDNLCPECASGDLDLGTNGDGRWEIEWIAVPCPGNIGGLQYMGQGSNPFYIKLQVRNHRIPVSDVFFRINGNFESTQRTSDNFFVYNPSSALSGNLQIRVTAVDGQVVEDEISIDSIISSQPFSGTGVQFSTPNAPVPVSPAPASPSRSRDPAISPSRTPSSAPNNPQISLSRTPTSFVNPSRSPDDFYTDTDTINRSAGVQILCGNLLLLLALVMLM